MDLKEALIWKIKHPAQDAHEMTTVLHNLAYGRDADFDFHTKWIQAVQNLSYEEFVSVANTFLDRPKLSFAVAGESSEPNARKEKSVAKIRDQLIYKSKANQH